MFSCTSWKQVSIDKYHIPDKEYYVILHKEQDQWFMYDVEISNDSIHGMLSNVTDKSLEARFLHLYIASITNIPEDEHVLCSIAIEDILTAQVSEPDRKRSLGISYATFGAYAITVAVIFLLFYFAN
jgi:hypothetical protein